MENKFKASIFRKKRNIQSMRNSKNKLGKFALVFSGILLLGFLLRVWIVLIILQIGQFVFTPMLPDIDSAEALFTSQSTIIYDREGSELYTIHGDENRFEIPLEKIPETVRLATIAAEDDDFYKHLGFDANGIIRAILNQLGFKFFGVGGGSTITQQFVKNAYLSPEKTYSRKAQELMLALKLENKFTKNEILEMYLNRIPYGGNAYGIQAAAQTFFDKNAEDLTLAEAAVLAALPQRPSRYSPYGQNREFLMGRCGKVESEASTSDSESVKLAKVEGTLDLEIEATGKVWLQIFTDEEIKKEGVFEKGETYEIPFDKNFQIISGNQNFQFFVNGEEVSTEGQSNFSASKQDFAKMESVIALSCTSPDDVNYETGRKDYVLRRMLDLGFISEAEFQIAWKESNNLKFTAYREEIRSPHFVFFVRDLLEEKFGKDVVERGGLRVFTTLQPSFQAEAEELIASKFPQSKDSEGNVAWKHNRFDATNASLLAVDNETGQILAMVGSRDYFEVLREDGYGNDGATNLTTWPRQPGSSFKPVAYTAGLQQGYTPASIFWDVKTNFAKNIDNYTPQNYDGKFMGPMSMRQSIGHSRNIPAVKMAILAGELAVAETAHQLGIASVEDDNRYGPTIALGVAEIPMFEMVEAYSVFANGGYSIQPTPILKITDSRGNIIEEFEKESQQKELVLDPAVAYLMTDMLSDPESRPQGWNNSLNLVNRPNGAKTGTANKKISRNEILPNNVWTIGFTPQITTAVWMGNNDGTPMSASATGLTSAAPIWKDFMDFAHKNLPAKAFKIPAGIAHRSVSKLTGKLASATTPVDQITVETFLSSALPSGVDNAFIEIEVDVVSEKIPTSLTPESAIVKKKFVSLHSERDYDSEWERPVREWLKKNYEEDENTIFKPSPTDFDDAHTTETAKHKPAITIVSPISGSMVRKSSIGVWVDVTAFHGVEKVEYYRDENLVATALALPWKGVIPISMRLNDGDKVNITAKVFDKLYYSTASSVQVTVGEDTQPPTVKLVSPTKNQKISRGDFLLVKADAFDTGGDIKRAIFYLDGDKFAETTFAPYEAPLVIHDSISFGNHTLKISVMDTANLSTNASVNFEVVEGGKSFKGEDFAIIFPKHNSKISSKAKVEIIAQVDRAKFIPQKIDFIIRNIETGEKSTLASLENPNAEILSVVWEDLAVGKYEIYLKAWNVSGKMLISGRSFVEVR